MPSLSAQIGASILAFAVVAGGACALGRPRGADAPRADDNSSSSDVASRVVELVEDQMRATGATAVSVALVAGDEIVFARGFGAGPLEGEIDADSVFRVGSLSKLVVCVLAKQLEEQGKLDLDAPLSAALPRFAIKSRFAAPTEITPRSIMTHHSGLPSDLLRGMFGSGRARFTDYVELLRDEHVSSPPGTVFAYSDAAFAVLGHAEQEVAGKPFAALARDALFAPLGMARSSFEPDGAVARQRVTAWASGAAFDELPPITLPANGLVSSANDLARLLMMLMRPQIAQSPDSTLSEAGARIDVHGSRASDASASTHASARIDASASIDASAAILSRASIDDIFRTQNAHVPLDVMQTGLGLNLVDEWAQGSGPLAWHSGSTVAFRSEIVMLPKHRLGVVVLTNTHEATLLPSAVAWAALRALLESTTSLAPPPRSAPREGASFAAGELESFAGLYATDYGLVDLAARDDGLRGRAFDQDVELVPTTSRTFYMKVLALGFLPVQPDFVKDVELRFERRAGEMVLASEQRDGVWIGRGVRVTAASVTPAWRARVGRYANLDPGDDQLTIEGAELRLLVHRTPSGGRSIGAGPPPRGADKEILVLAVDISRNAGPFLVALEPVDDDTAITAGLGRYMGETVRAVRGGPLVHAFGAPPAADRPGAEPVFSPRALESEREDERLVVLGYPLARTD